MYAGLALIAIGLQWFVYRQTTAPAIILTSGIVVDAILATIVFAQTKGDVDGASAAEIWARILERLWAVVIVDFIVSFVGFVGIGYLVQGDLADRIVAIPILLIAAGAVFAEAVAVVDDGGQWWFLVVRALGTSIRTSWSGSTLWRAIVLFALQFVPTAVSSLLTNTATQHHVKITSFWSDVPLGIIFSIPLDALIVLAFFDATGYEPNRTCGE